MGDAENQPACISVSHAAVVRHRPVFSLADGQQSPSIVQMVSILFTAGTGAFREAVQYKEVTILAAAVLLSAMTILRNPVVKRR